MCMQPPKSALMNLKSKIAASDVLKANILTDLPERQAERFGDKAALAAPDHENRWRDISWRRYAADVRTASLCASPLSESASPITWPPFPPTVRRIW